MYGHLWSIATHLIVKLTMTITNIEGSESESNRYYDLPDQKPSLNTENEEYFEDSLLLGRGRRTTPAPAICRSRSVSSSRLISESSGLSIWTLSRLQKIVLVITAIVDLLTFLSVSIMAPFFPEEVGTGSLSTFYKHQHDALCLAILGKICITLSITLQCV